MAQYFDTEAEALLANAACDEAPLFFSPLYEPLDLGFDEFEGEYEDADDLGVGFVCEQEHEHRI